MRYKHGLTLRSSTGVLVNITAEERPLLVLELACLKGQRSHRQDLIAILFSYSDPGLHIYLPRCCANWEFAAFFALAIEQLQHIGVTNPDLARRILTHPDIPQNVKACFSE